MIKSSCNYLFDIGQTRWLSTRSTVRYCEYIISVIKGRGTEQQQQQQQKKKKKTFEFGMIRFIETKICWF